MGVGRKRDVSCADGVPAVESDRSCQCRVGRTERTAEEREDERGHDMGGRRRRQEDMMNSGIIVNVGELVHGDIIARRYCCRGGQNGAGQGRQGKGRVGAATGTGSGSRLDLGGKDR